MSTPGQRPRAPQGGKVHYSTAVDPDALEKTVSAVAAADEEARKRAGRKRPFNKEAHKTARSVYAGIVENAVSLRRRAGRDLTERERGDLLADVPKDFRAGAEQLVQQVNEDDGDRLPTDELARTLAVKFAGEAPANFTPPADTDTESVADVITHIPRNA
ncbi:MAG: hypothetical protein WD757_00585 [Actinomycetota bacterium]